MGEIVKTRGAEAGCRSLYLMCHTLSSSNIAIPGGRREFDALE